MYPDLVWFNRFPGKKAQNKIDLIDINFSQFIMVAYWGKLRNNIFLEKCFFRRYHIEINEWPLMMCHPRYATKMLYEEWNRYV